MIYAVLSVAALAAFWAGWGACLIANPALTGRHHRGRGDPWSPAGPAEQGGETFWLKAKRP